MTQCNVWMESHLCVYLFVYTLVLCKYSSYRKKITLKRTSKTDFKLVYLKNTKKIQHRL